MENKQSFLLDDTVYSTELTKKFLNRKKWQPKNPKIITAFIPGTIREIYVTAGQQVRAGDKLLILEAMKMRNTVTAEMDGTIKTIAVSSGSTVAKNQLILEFA